MRRNPAKLHKSFKKGFKAEEGKHIIPTHDGRVIFALAWLSGVGSVTSAPAHHAMDDEKRILLYHLSVKKIFHFLYYEQLKICLILSSKVLPSGKLGPVINLSEKSETEKVIFLFKFISLFWPNPLNSPRS